MGVRGGRLLLVQLRQDDLGFVSKSLERERRRREWRERTDRLVE